MQTVHASRVFEASKSDIWKVLDDFEGVDNWDDSIESASLIDGPEKGEGATRKCVIETGDSVTEKIVEYQPESLMKIQVIETGPFPVNQMTVE